MKTLSYILPQKILCVKVKSSPELYSKNLISKPVNCHTKVPHFLTIGKDTEKQNKKSKLRIKMEEERAAEQKRLREEEIKESTKNNIQVQIEEEKDQIQALEREAQNLELIEQELLQKLQSTQMMEKDAFAELEKAMIASSENRRHKFENSHKG